MTIEKNIKFTMDNADQCAIGTTLNIVTEMFDTMTANDALRVNGSEYSRDNIDEIIGFLIDLWHMDSGTCEIVED